MRLEFVSIIIFLGLVFNYGFGNYDRYISIYYLVFSACESAFGLGVIVLIVRSLGNDMFGNIRII
jgi:NADH:ubiquinone oxidoreductase subunit K